MCINRDEKPTTCCAGCTLTCGIITYFVLQCLGLLAALCSMNLFNITFSLFEVAPVVALYFANESYCVRMWNYLHQIVSMVILVLVLLIAIVGIEALITLVCSDANFVSVMETSN